MRFRLLIFACFIWVSAVQAEISMNNAQLSINNGLYNIPQDLGQTVGNNVFHSFDRFNLNQGEIAQLSGSDSIQNIISRVIGGEQSFINGTIRSTIPDANFYFLNPYGVMFGESAKLELQGSFHASTADYLKLSDGGEFHAKFPERDILTAAPIESFGFLTSTPANISFENSRLDIENGRDFSLTAGNISMRNTQIKAPSSHLYLATIGDIGELKLNDFTLKHLQGEVTLSQQSLLETSGDSSGSISIRAGQFVMNQTSKIIAQTQGDQDGGIIDIAANDIALYEGSNIDASVTGLGTGAEIKLTATNSIMAIGENADLVPSLITAYADAELNQEQDSSENQTGDAGSITMSAKNIQLRDGASIISDTSSTGNGGNVYVTAEETLSFAGQGTQSDIYQTSVRSMTRNKSDQAGKGSDVFLTAEQILIEDSAEMAIRTYGANDSGNLTLTAHDVFLDSIYIMSMSFSTGNTGFIQFDVDNHLSLYAARVLNLAMNAGNAGYIKATAKDMTFDYGSYFSSFSRRTGTASDISIEATGLVQMIGARRGFVSGLTSDSSPTQEGIIAGRAGNVSVKAGDLIIRDGARISSNSFSRFGFNAGEAGDIDIDVRGTIDISGVNPFGESEEGFASGVYARSLGVGDNGSRGGNIRLKAHSLKLTDGGAITSSTDNYAPSGTIDITVQDSIEISGDSSHIVLQQPGSSQVKFLETYAVSDFNQSTSGIFARSLNNNVQSGSAGSINLSAQTLKMSNNGSISTSSAGGGEAGHINIEVKQLDMDSSARIASESQMINRYQFDDIEARDTSLVKQGDVVEVADLGNGKGGYYINVGTHLVQTYAPIPPVENLEELNQLSEKYSLLNGQVVEVKDIGNGESAQYIYNRHFRFPDDATWMRLEQQVSTVLDNPDQIFSERNDSGYDIGEQLPDYRVGERIRVLDMGDGKSADFIYATLQRTANSFTYVTYIRVNQFNVSDPSELNTLSAQVSLESEYPIATLNNEQYLYTNNHWVALNTQLRQVDRVVDMNALNLAKTGNVSTIANQEQIYTGQQWVNLNPVRRTVQTMDELQQLPAVTGDLVKVMNAGRPDNYLYAEGEWHKQEHGGDAGTITIQTDSLQMASQSAITSEAVSSGGGGIRLKVDNMLYLDNSRISASVREGAGNGGSLSLYNTQFLIMSDARLIAQAYEGQGGNILIAAEQFIRNPTSFVSASSQLGIDGNVRIESPDETISGDLLALNNRFLQQIDLQDSCRGTVRGQLPTEFQKPLSLTVKSYRPRNHFEDWIPSDTVFAKSCKALKLRH